MPTLTVPHTSAIVAPRTGAGRANQPHRLPDDVASLLATFGLTLPALLTTSSAKAQHTAAHGVHNAMHYALPHRQLARAIDPRTVATTAPRGYVPALRELAERTGTVDAAMRHNGCMHATAGCVAACLASAGHGGLSVDVTAARGRRTLAHVADPITYARAVTFAIAAELARAARAGMPTAVRLNGTAEWPWFARAVPVSLADALTIRRRYGVDVDTGAFNNVAETFAPMVERGAVRFYEYLKAHADAPDGLRAWRAAGFDVTASFAADRATACADAVAAVRAGFRVALPIALKRGAPLPSSVTFETHGETVTLPTVDGDTTDARYADPCGVAVLLREKRARGADRTRADRFVLPYADAVTLADGVVRFNR